jgi:hypothetical protein
MCYERYRRSQQAEAEEERRRMWDTFARETAGEAPRAPNEEQEVETPEPPAPEHATANAER